MTGLSRTEIADNNGNIKQLTDKRLTVLGSTGSIGTQALDVCRYHNIRVDAISAASNDKLLEAQVREFKPALCAITDEAKANDLRVRLADTETRVLGGPGAVCDMLELSKSDTVINSVIGRAGLLPTLKAIECGKSIALANKETLVTAGELVMRSAAERGVTLLPIDSEHCAIFECLMCGRREEVSRLILTASGGPFFGRTAAELENVGVDRALNHPTWKMGRKITIDSATLMNKCFEIIEAAYLFGFPHDMIDVVIHRESIVHSMVEYNDGAIIAQMGLPDMRMCIAYAVSYPFRVSGNCKKTDLAAVGGLTFAKPDFKTFQALSLAPYALSRAGVVPAALNGANEAAVELFLDGKIRFTDITELVKSVVYSFPDVSEPSLEAIIEAGDTAFNEVKRLAAG